VRSPLLRASVLFGELRSLRERYFGALTESTWIVLVFGSSVPTTWTFWPANFFSSVFPFSV
jgi:hypothetical protein